MGREGAERYGGATEGGHRPGDRRSRLAGAEKQLEIVLQEVDLEAEPAVGAALTEAISAVDRASRLSEAAEGSPEPARSAPDDGHPAGSDDEHGAEWVMEERDRPLQQLVREAHAE